MIELEKETQDKNSKCAYIPRDMYIKLICLGLYDPSGVRDNNAGKSIIVNILFNHGLYGWIIQN